jgi:hypothetical protein
VKKWILKSPLFQPEAEEFVEPQIIKTSKSTKHIGGLLVSCLRSASESVLRVNLQICHHVLEPSQQSWFNSVSVKTWTLKSNHLDVALPHPVPMLPHKSITLPGCGCPICKIQHRCGYPTIDEHQCTRIESAHKRSVHSWLLQWTFDELIMSLSQEALCRWADLGRLWGATVYSCLNLTLAGLFITLTSYSMWPPYTKAVHVASTVAVPNKNLHSTIPEFLYFKKICGAGNQTQAFCMLNKYSTTE